MRIDVSPLEYRLRRGLTTGGGSLATRSGFSVALRDDAGAVGVGEALPLPAAGTESLGESQHALQRAAADCTRRWRGRDELLDWLDTELAQAPAARCALDVAAQALSPPDEKLRTGPVEVNALLGSDGIDATVTAARAARGRGYRTLKLKIGAGPAGDDEARLAAVRGALGADVRLRVDANGAWSLSEARRRIERLVPFALEFVEQPLPALQLDELAKLREWSPLPLAADESLASEAGRAALLGGDLADIAILKPMVLGGPRAAARLARDAHAAGLRCVVTTTFDGPCATAATLRLAAAVGDPELAHGLAACEVLDCEFPEGLVPRNGELDPRRIPR